VQPFEQLLAASDAFAEHLFTLAHRLGELQQGADACAAACELSLEHAQSLRLLLAHAAANSACGLLRLQYESLLRAGWLLYCATPAERARAGGGLSAQGERRAQGLAGAKEMLQDLVKAATADARLAGLVLPLQEIHANSWKAMNSFVHAGLHPLRRSREGFPVHLADQVVRTSNGMMHLAVRLLYRVSVAPKVSALEIERAYRGFETCLPVSPQ
jgi:hypothetical protein